MGAGVLFLATISLPFWAIPSQKLWTITVSSVVCLFSAHWCCLPRQQRQLHDIPLVMNFSIHPLAVNFPVRSLIIWSWRGGCPSLPGQLVGTGYKDHPNLGTCTRLQFPLPVAFIQRSDTGTQQVCSSVGQTCRIPRQLGPIAGWAPGLRSTLLEESQEMPLAQGTGGWDYCFCFFRKLWKGISVC